MFNNLVDFSYKRNWKEAVGFYLAYLVLGVILAAIAGGLSSFFSEIGTFEQGYNQGVKAGSVTGVIFCLLISIVLLKQKKLFINFGYIILALLGVILSLLGGLLFGLMIPAYLTTKPKPN